MKTTRILACLLASVMACGAFTACGEKEESSSKKEESSSSSTVDESSASDSSSDSESSEEATTKAPVAVDVEDFEPANAAEPGDAYLAMVDEQVWLQYWGKSEDGSPLAYDAGIADITGDGQYTVSVSTATNGCRYDTTGDVNGEILGAGVSFMAVMIPDGESLYPGAIMTIDSIKVDGTEVEMLKKGYTSSDDGKETRVNIFNTYIKDNPPSPDARTADGFLYTDGDSTKPIDACADYAPCIIDTADFAEWSTVEVTFTITGTGLDGGAAEGGEAEATEAEATEAAAE